MINPDKYTKKHMSGVIRISSVPDPVLFLRLALQRVAVLDLLEIVHAPSATLLTPNLHATHPLGREQERARVKAASLAPPAKQFKAESKPTWKRFERSKIRPLKVTTPTSRG